MYSCVYKNSRYIKANAYSEISLQEESTLLIWKEKTREIKVMDPTCSEENQHEDKILAYNLKNAFLIVESVVL